MVALACALRRRGHEICVVTLYGGEAFAADLAKAGIEHRVVGKRGRYDLLVPHWRIAELVREWRADIFYSFLPAQNLAAIVMSPFLGGAKVVLGVRAAYLDASQYDGLAGLSYGLEPYVAHFSNLIIANSASGLRWCMDRGFPSKKLRLVPNGVDTSRFCPDPEARSRLRESLSLGPEKILIATICRLDVMKDHPLFLRAAARLAVLHPEMVFACVGNGDSAYLAELKRIASGLNLEDRLLWLPAQENVEAVLNAADICVLPSAHGEGFPNIMVEAMACGTPIVSTGVGDCAAIADQLLPVVPPGDDEAMAQAVEVTLRRLKLERGEYRERLRERVLRHYSVDVLGATTEALLQGIAAGSRIGI